VTEWVRRHPTQDGAHEFTGAVDLGELEAPPELRPAVATPRYLVELTLDPLFTLAVGRVDTRESFSIPRGTWDHFDPTTYYVRMLALPDLAPIGAWRFRKTSPGLGVQSDAEFLARLADSHLPAEIAR
jgi:hypothetical protein